jgi:hypothetical protein
LYIHLCLQTNRRVSGGNTKIAAEKVQANTGTFWLKYENECAEFSSFAKRVLTMPSSSAAVERVFSVGGAIFNFTSMPDRLFKVLMFLSAAGIYLKILDFKR